MAFTSAYGQILVEGPTQYFHLVCSVSVALILFFIFLIAQTLPLAEALTCFHKEVL